MEYRQYAVLGFSYVQFYAFHPQIQSLLESLQGVFSWQSLDAPRWAKICL